MFLHCEVLTPVQAICCWPYTPIPKPSALSPTSTYFLRDSAQHCVAQRLVDWRFSPIAIPILPASPWHGRKDGRFSLVAVSALNSSFCRKDACGTTAAYSHDHSSFRSPDSLMSLSPDCLDSRLPTPSTPDSHNVSDLSTPSESLDCRLSTPSIFDCHLVT
jgi:hypothetical protein